MTIQDMLDAGITIQGAYDIRSQNKSEEIETIEAGSDFEMEQYDIDEDILNREITYMYSIPTPSGYSSYLVIEVE